jgi:hypothetical protein
MAGNKVPQTLVRLSQQLALIGFQQVDDTANPFDTSGLSNIVDTITSLRFIGATNRFRVSQERTFHQRQGIGDVESFAIAPGNVTTKIDMDRMMLNTEDAMAVFQFMPGNIAFQTRPIVLLELTVPALGSDNLPVVNTTGAGSGNTSIVGQIANGLFGNTLHRAAASVGRSVSGVLGVISSIADLAKTPTYTGCWITSRQAEYKLDGAQAVIENVSMIVTRVSPAVGMIMPSLEATIIENMPVVTRGVQIARSLGR